MMDLLQRLTGRKPPYKARTMKGHLPFTFKFLYAVLGLVAPTFNSAGLKYTLNTLTHFAGEISFSSKRFSMTNVQLGLKLFGIGVSLAVSVFDGEHVIATDFSLYFLSFGTMTSFALNTPAQVKRDIENDAADAEFRKEMEQSGMVETEYGFVPEMLSPEQVKLYEEMKGRMDADLDTRSYESSYGGGYSDPAPAPTPKRRKASTTGTRRTSRAAAKTTKK